MLKYPNKFIRMVVFKNEGLLKSKIVISEIYSDVYTKITKHRTLLLALDLYTYLQNYQLYYKN